MRNVYFIYLIVFFLSIAQYSCTKESAVIEEVKPSAQYIELKVIYSGTALCPEVWGCKHNLHIDIDDTDGNTYKDFEEQVSMNALVEGRSLVSSFKVEPGSYEINGFWDWNDSGTWDDFEQYISPTFIDIAGYDTADVDVPLVDNTYIYDDGWIHGTVTYDGSETGIHDVYIEVLRYGGNGEIENVKISATPINLSEQSLNYSVYIYPGTDYWFTFFWDTNDNGDLDHFENGDPSWLVNFINISPGLPVVVSVDLRD